MSRFLPRYLAVALSVVATACQPTPSPRTVYGSPTPAFGAANQISLQGDFKAPLGVQLYTFRVLAKEDPVKMLETVHQLGFTHVEGGSTYGMSLEKYMEVLKANGLRTTSMLASYERFRDSADAIAAEAKALGATYAGIAWYPHQGTFTEADARKAIADFNAIGKTMKEAGLQFFYHNHGYEPVAFGDGTLLDLIIRETDPNLVKFEMDVLWTFLPNVDPAALIRKYPGRFKLMHIKDMKPGVARGSLTGGLPDSLQAVIGQGQVNWPEVMKAAKADGLEYYYLEDETPDPKGNIPPSVAYLGGVRF